MDVQLLHFSIFFILI